MYTKLNRINGIILITMFFNFLPPYRITNKVYIDEVYFNGLSVLKLKNIRKLNYSIYDINIKYLLKKMNL